MLVYAEKTEYMISLHQNLRQNQNVSMANELFENVEKFRHLGTTLTNQNDIHDEIKRGYLLSFSLDLLSSCLILKKTKA
jgi:hypothetical protein